MARSPPWIGWIGWLGLCVSLTVSALDQGEDEDAVLELMRGDGTRAGAGAESAAESAAEVLVCNKVKTRRCCGTTAFLLKSGRRTGMPVITQIMALFQFHFSTVFPQSTTDLNLNLNVT